MKVQHVVILGSASPYIRVIKFTDEVGEVQTLPFASPVPLVAASFSPDGTKLVALIAASGTDVIKMWTRPDSVSDNWTEVTVPSVIPGVARLMRDVEFMANNEVIIAGESILWAATIDAVTHAFTFTQLNASNSYGNVRRIVSLQNRETFQIFESRADNSGSGVRSMYRNGGVWTGFTASISSYMNAGRKIDENTIWSCTNGTPLNRAQKLTATKPPAAVSGGFVRILATDDITQDGAGATTAPVGRACVSPDGKLVIQPTWASPYIAFRHIQNDRVAPGPANFYDTGRLTAPTLTARVVDTENLDAGVFLFAFNSATLGTGRVRGYRYNGPFENITEITAISDLFDDWNSTPIYLAAADAIEVADAPAVLYNSGIEDIVSGVVDLTSLKIALLSNAAIFNPAHTTLAQALGANEVYGSSWPQGGIATDDGVYEKFGTGADYALRISIPSLNMADPGTITFRKAVIYDDSHVNKKPLGFITFSADQTATQFDRMQFSSVNNRFAIFSLSED